MIIIITKCTCICMYIHIYVYTYIYICMYIYVYILLPIITTTMHCLSVQLNIARHHDNMSQLRQKKHEQGECFAGCLGAWGLGAGLLAMHVHASPIA